MRGRVLSFDPMTSMGVISGQDGVRYNFSGADLKGAAGPNVVGAEVDFNGADGAATDIYLIAPSSDKNKVVAALLAFFLGLFGVHKFYLGRTTAGVIMLLCGTIGWVLFAIPPMVVGLIAFIEFIIYLTKSDQQFYQDYVIGDRSWF